MIILDISANTHKNSMSYVKRMIDELVKVDSRKHEVVIKHQLFTEAGENIPLQLSVFDFAYWYAEQQGYQTTASVFDLDSLRFLLTYDIPFVKIANRPDLYWLAGEVPRNIPVYASFSGMDSLLSSELSGKDIIPLWCVSKYPATMSDYENIIGGGLFNNDVSCLRDSGSPVFDRYPFISDHTTNFTLYHKYNPDIYECHYKLADSTGLDAGSFSRTAEQMAEIL